MSASSSRENSYLALVELLLLAKQHLFELGGLHDLNGLQTMSLLLLSQPQPMGNFKTYLHCDPSNVTTIMDALEERKLVKRYTSPTDRRIKMVKLMSAGEQLRIELLQSLTHDDDFLFANLSSAERTTLVKLLHKATAPKKNDLVS